MKRFIGSFMLICAFLLSGCFDTVEETTFNEDGSGTYVSSTNMSKMFDMIEQMGASMGGDNEKMKDLEKLAIDTVMRLVDMADSAALIIKKKSLLLAIVSHFQNLRI
jgi:PBP1b-binding outer membrane lipoprotein LpoB